MRLLLATFGSPGSPGSPGSHVDVEPVVGPAPRLRALKARGAGMPVCARASFAGQLARVGLPPALAMTTGVMPNGAWL